MVERLRCQTCGDKFVREQHNQVYCGEECRRESIRKKSLNRYYERKRKRTTRRICDYQGCATVLSRYNMEDNCSIHATL